MKTYILMTILGICFTTHEQVYACNLHPGITHKEWTSSIADERTKSGAVKVTSDSFFSTAGTGKNQEDSKRSPQSSGRAIREIR